MRPTIPTPALPLFSLKSASISVHQRPILGLIRVDPCKSVVNLFGRRQPIPDTPINSSVKVLTKTRPKNVRVTWAYFHDSKGAHKKLEANNHSDHNELVMVEMPHHDQIEKAAREAARSKDSAYLPFRSGSVVAHGAAAGDGLDRRRIRIEQSGVIRAEAELDQRAGVGNDFGLPALGGLKALHGGLGADIPNAVRLPVHVALADEGGLDFANALGVHRLLAAGLLSLGGALGAFGGAMAGLGLTRFLSLGLRKDRQQQRQAQENRDQAKSLVQKTPLRFWPEPEILFSEATRHKPQRWNRASKLSPTISIALMSVMSVVNP